jgi:pimeloyl-ACP methyl ester carboxylesterase
MQQFQEDPLMFNPEWIGKDPRDDSVAERFLFHDCPPDILVWALATRRVFVVEGAIKQVYPLQAWPNTDSTYIVCSEDRTISPEWSRRVASERPGVQAIELPGGHCPHVSRPQTLAEVLSRVATGRTTN